MTSPLQSPPFEVGIVLHSRILSVRALREHLLLQRGCNRYRYRLLCEWT